MTTVYLVLSWSVDTCNATERRLCFLHDMTCEGFHYAKAKCVVIVLKAMTNLAKDWHVCAHTWTDLARPGWCIACELSWPVLGSHCLNMVFGSSWLWKILYRCRAAHRVCLSFGRDRTLGCRCFQWVVDVRHEANVSSERVRRRMEFLFSPLRPLVAYWANTHHALYLLLAITWIIDGKKFVYNVTQLVHPLCPQASTVAQLWVPPTALYYPRNPVGRLLNLSMRQRKKSGALRFWRHAWLANEQKQRLIGTPTHLDDYTVLRAFISSAAATDLSAIGAVPRICPANMTLSQIRLVLPLDGRLNHSFASSIPICRPGRGTRRLRFLGVLGKLPILWTWYGSSGLAIFSFTRLCPTRGKIPPWGQDFLMGRVLAMYSRFFFLRGLLLPTITPCNFLLPSSSKRNSGFSCPSSIETCFSMSCKRSPGDPQMDGFALRC